MRLAEWTTLLVAFTLFSCSGPKIRTAQQGEVDEVTGVTLPEIPDTIAEPERIGEYLLLHFWDGLEMDRTEQCQDTAFMEQSFANFIAVVPYGTEETAREAIGKLVEKVAEREEAMRLLDWVAWKYLDEPNSPMRSEELYVLFLESYAGNERVPEDVRARAADRLERAMMNRPGTVAADVRLLSREGRRMTLLDEVSVDTTLVMFYDPECEHCREITGRLIAASAGGMVPYRVLAIDVTGHREAWERSAGELPETWVVATALVDVEDKELYHFPALPSLYLLGRDGEVILKDFTPGF